MEFGLTFEREGSDLSSVDSWTFPQVELHVGISSRLEVSVIWDGLVSTTTLTPAGVKEHPTAAADFRIGAKLGLTERPHFDAALIGYLNAPVGNALVTGGYADPSARLAWTVPISDRFGFVGTADLKATREADRGVHAKPAASAAFGSRLAGALAGFAGVVAEPPEIGSRPSLWSIEGGLVLPVGEHTQIDLSGSRRVAGDPGDWFVSAGFVRRLR